MTQTTTKQPANGHRNATAVAAAATLAAGALLLNGEHEPVYQLATADENPLWLGGLVELLVDAVRSGAFVVGTVIV